MRGLGKLGEPIDALLRRDLPVRALSLLALCLGVLALTVDIWLPRGNIVFSDLDFGLYDPVYIQRIFGFFNDQFSSMNFFNLSRLVFILPFWLGSVVLEGIYEGFLLKSIIMGCLFLSAIGMFRLCEYLLLTHFGKFSIRYHYIGLIVPSLYYALNPWVIFRIQHIFLLCGYAVFPWVVIAFFSLFPVHNRNKATENSKLELTTFRILGRRFILKSEYWHEVKCSARIGFFVGVGSAAIHYFFYFTLTFIALGFLISLHNYREGLSAKTVIVGYIRKNILMFTSVSLFGAYWLLSYVAATFFASIEPHNVNVIDTLQMFSRNSELLNVVYMVSYWWTMFETEKFLDRGFWIGGGVYLALVAYIVFYRYNWHFYVKLFTWIVVFVTCVALGVNQDATSDFFVFLVTKVPVIGHIFRDPNKLLGPMALFVSVLIAFSVDKLIVFLRQSGFSRLTQIIFVFVLIVSFFFYYRPFYIIFIKEYYAGIQAPEDYYTVQENFLPGGKILWTPNMDNMTLSNGLASYDWNTSSDIPGMMKVSGDFHTYSSKKNFIFQHENNHSMVAYFYSYLQNLLDTGNAHYVGSLLSWAGFNELGFHQDVFGQAERQQFNKTVLDEQFDLREHYKNNIHTLYTTPYPQDEVYGLNNFLYLTKPFPSLNQVFDFRGDLRVDPINTGLLWSPSRKQDVTLTEDDIIVGDSEWDLLLPLIDDKYFISPFHEVNSGNPYTGWAKTYAKESEWFWQLKVNGIRTFDWDYDYGKGLVYTYSPYKVTIPPYKLAQYEGEKLLDMRDVMSDFFIQDEPSIVNLTYFPDVDVAKNMIVGKINKSSSASNIWKVVKSKEVEIEGGRFIRLKAVVSGTNAGSLHFKVKFFDKYDDEIKVDYVTTSENMDDAIRANMLGDFYVPRTTSYMRIDILNMQSSNKPVYFWLHDFAIYDLYSDPTPNTLELKPTPSPSKSYRVFARVFRSKNGGEGFILSGKDKVPVPTQSELTGFEWVDLGEVSAPKEVLELYPGEGFTAINVIVAIPTEEFDQVYSKAKSQLRGKQADLSLFASDFKLTSDLPILNLQEIRTQPNTINNSFALLNKGKLTKEVSILRDTDFKISLTGNISSKADLTYSVYDLETNNLVATNSVKGTRQLHRSFQDKKGVVNYVPNSYYLSLENSSPSWIMNRYDLGLVSLKAGTYRIEVEVNSNLNNKLQDSSLHILNSDEIVIPPAKVTAEDQAVRLMNIILDDEDIVLEETNVSGVKYLKNKATSSAQWIIYALDKVPVKKGQLIVFQSKTESKNIKDLHSKLMFMDTKFTLLESKYVPLKGDSTDTFYYLIEVKEDGYVQPTYFLHGSKEADGLFRTVDSDFYVVDDFVKLEGSALLPSKVDGVAPSTKSKKLGYLQYELPRAEMVLFNEAYSPVWRFPAVTDSEPLLVNFFHNGFVPKDPKATLSGEFIVTPVLTIPYKVGLTITIAVHGIVIFFFLRERAISRIKRGRRHRPNRPRFKDYYDK